MFGFSALRRIQVEDFTVARASKHPRSALDGLQFLKRVLRDARDRNQRVDEVCCIKAVKHAPRRGRALTVDQLHDLASWFPEHVSRLVLEGEKRVQARRLETHVRASLD